MNPGRRRQSSARPVLRKRRLFSLSPRLYDVTGGEILVDGRNVKDYTVEHLRDAVSMVLQKNVLFTGTNPGQSEVGAMKMQRMSR